MPALTVCIICPVALPAFAAGCEDPWAYAKKMLGREGDNDPTLQALCLDDGVVVLCDEEGLFKNLPLNRQIPARMPELPADMVIIDATDGNHPAPGELGVHRIHGDFVLTRYPIEGDGKKAAEWACLTDADIAKYLELLNRPWAKTD